MQHIVGKLLLLDTMKKLSYLPVLFILFMLPLAALADDPVDKIAELLKKANITELEKQFGANIDITILKEENVYSKTQASMILSKFFTQNKPKSVKIIHKVNTNNVYRFGVIQVVTDKGTYRVSCTLNGVNGILQIIDLRIEPEKA